MKTMKRFSTLFAILLILSISTYVGDIQNAVANEADWMPDANLRTAVRSALNLNKNDALTQAGMANLTTLTARNAQISNLTGLEHATNLTSLDLRDNTINNISALSGLTNLESLKLKSNAISSVSALSGLTNLTLLNLKENNISSISGLSGLTNLEHLRVDANSITDVQPLTSLVNLERLWIAGNSLTNAHLLSSLTGLAYIDISIPDPPDTTAPSVTVSVPSGTQNGAFDATITFTESVSNFVQSDVSLRGSAASITSWRANSGNTVYTATITPTASGTVTIGVAANVATDAANNQNTAATSKTVTVSVDTTAPGVTVSVPSGVQNGAFNATITFTESVSGFTQSDVSLRGSAASITAWRANSGNTVYTATITPTASGTVTIGVAANVATDAANNANTAATSKTVSIDVDKPTVTIGVPSGTQTSAFNATITFTESVSNFVQSDVSLSGSAASITSWRANSGNTVYTATITPTASGTVTIGVAANVATDAANNQNTAATSKNVTVSVDTTAPGVTVSVPSGVQNGAFNATITFTESVSGFTQSEVSLRGSAASITGWRANSDNTVYTAAITPTASGTVTIGVAANVATDAANNPNTAATSQTVTVDVDKPSVTISVPSGTQTSAFNATITFSETVSGFTQSDVSLSGSAASITGWRANSSNTVYTATITPTASGTVTIGVAANVATDAANNQNTAATSKTVTVNIPDPIPDPSTWMPDANLRTAVRSALSLGNNDTLTQASMANLTRLTARNAQISNLTGLEYATNLTSLDLRDNTISNISALSGLTNLESLRLKGNNISSVSALSGLTNLTLLNLKENNISSVSALSELTNLEHLRVDANSITDVQPLTRLVNLNKLWIAGNSLTNAHLLSSLTGLAYIDISIPDPPDTTAPSVTVSVPSGTQNGAFNVTITFTESVSNFVQSDVSLRGSAASITSWRANSGNTVYTATITPTARGTVTIGVDANVATDAANNQNTAATSKTVSVDVDKPTVTIGVPSGVQNGAFDATITFTESVSNFVQSDVSLRGSAASITSWRANSSNTVYTATITPTASGTVTIGVAANVATDAANNANTAATSKTVTVDVDRPSVSIGVPAGTQTGAFDVTITFTEAVSNFVGSDVSLSGSAASITGWRANSGNTVYTATITPTASGTVTIGVAANVATDAANNQNTAATSKSVTVSVDTTSPGVTVSVPSGTQNGAFSVTIMFTESVSNFVQSDVSLRGSAASITSWRANSSNTVYTATITPTASGTVTIGVAANVATDAANNQNTAATSKTVSIDVDKPTVTIGVPSGTQINAFNATITFSETVSGFTQSDVSLSSSAASITSWRANSSNTVYTATITATANGTVTIGVAANVATDAANNANTAATSKTVAIRTVTILVVQSQPGVSILVPSGVQNGAFDATITFSETVSGFVGSEVSLSGSAASITSWRANSDNTVYTATITPTASGTVTIGVAANVATDAANNQNTAATTQTVTVDLDPPSVTLTLPSEVEGSRFDVQITFNEPVEGFESTDLSITTNGLTQLTTTAPPPIVSITGWTPSQDKTTYTVYITTRTKTEGQVIINVPADVATDIAGNSNVAGSELSVDLSIDGPVMYLVVLTSGPHGFGPHDPSGCHLRNISRFRDYLDVNGDGSIDGDDVALVEAALGQFGDGIVNSGTDINCDNTVDNDDLALVDDTESPTFSISVPRDAQSGAFDITIISSEPVFDFDGTDISLVDSTAMATATMKYYSYGDPDGTVTYSFTITPTTSGDLVISIPAGAAKDALDNQNTASAEHTVTVDMSIPSVSITFARVEPSVFKIIITFSEAVSGFEQADLSVSGGAGASITAWETTDNTTFTATVTATTNGSVYYYVPAGVATDAGGKLNTASRLGYQGIDLDPPTVEVSVPTGEQSGAFDVTITFSEKVYNFEQADVSLADGTAAATITDWTIKYPNSEAYRTTFEATITPMTSGTVAITIPADVATDAIGNGNTASNTHSITVSLPGSSRAPASLSGIVLDPTVLKTLDPEVLEAHLDILRTGSDGSLKYLQAIALLESVLAEMRPEKTVLLANYPNPFNPETWIPYHLAKDTFVVLTIYDGSGRVVRTLEVGHQTAAVYESRSKAVYWDGRNGLGEQVASGLYFYALTAGDYSATRKMLILK